jgi:ATP-dependent RNA helicase MSS116
MPPPPKRKFNRNRTGGAANGSGPGTPDTPTTPRSTMAQQPKRPKVNDALPTSVGTVDVTQMYSTSAGEATAKPFSALSSVLDKTLLDGLDKMGFE